MRKEKGITLVALIITIIIMLILVAVSVNVIVKSNLIGTAEKAANGYKTAYERENDGSITINGKTYGSLDEYMEEINPTIVKPENIADWLYNIASDGTITLTSYKGNDTTVIMPNYIKGKAVKKISGDTTDYTGNSRQHANYFSIWNKAICNGNENDNASTGYCKGQDTIENVIISEGIEEIERNAFQYSTALEEAILPKSIKSIGMGAFYGCKNLQKINIPQGIAKIDDNTFTHCTSLREITIPNSVTSIEVYAFSYCTSLTDITIPSRVATMGEKAFYGIPSITVHVPWKEGEEKPEGWDSKWNATMDNCTITIVYAK